MRNSTTLSKHHRGFGIKAGQEANSNAGEFTVKSNTTDTIGYDYDFLVEFEAGIDPLDPENSKIPARVLGYGEMSTVMIIDWGDPNLVYKRMPMGSFTI